MNVVCLVSGGKDSLYSCLIAKKSGYNISCFLTAIPERDDSWMFHIPNAKFVKYQASASNIPWEYFYTKGEKEKELVDLKVKLKELIKKYNIKGVVSGAIGSNYQKERIDKICEELGLQSIAPIWHKNSREYLHSLINHNFDIIIVGVSADGLGKSWLGRKIDNKFIEDVKKLNIHIAGEGGEYETFVLNCPLFNKKIIIKEMEEKWNNKLKIGNLIFRKVELV